jgi:hypothetical protein
MPSQRPDEKACRKDGLARRSTPGFLLFAGFFAVSAPNRHGAPPGAETFRSETVERDGRSLTTEGRRHRAMRISRFAWRENRKFCSRVAQCGKASLPLHEVCANP